ncbi:hypothetical protein M3Y97_00877200 [Aphelenchoides bicaudatus]|nr:hypothetical protein M3Y97_00877200 [Aphelenchoides bicaudatus]
MWTTKRRHKKLEEFQLIHPASGPVNAKDLFLLIGNRLGQKPKLMSTITSTAKFMSERGNRLHSTFSSWLNRGQTADKNNS